MSNIAALKTFLDESKAADLVTAYMDDDIKAIIDAGTFNVKEFKWPVANGIGHIHYIGIPRRVHDSIMSYYAFKYYSMDLVEYLNMLGV